jgi:transposase
VVKVMIVDAAGAFPCCRSRPQDGVIVSMQQRSWPDVPAETARVAKAAFRHGALAIRLRDELGCWYEDADFAAAFPVRGKPGISPALLAMVTVLQFAENLTDRQAAGAVRGRLDWKYCLGLELTDEGFDPSVLTGFRERLVAAGAERVIFDRLLDLARERGLVKAGGRQRVDSTHVLARVRDLNRLALAGETVRAALEALAAAAPDWLSGVIDASWQQVYGQRIDNMRLPDSAAARDRLAVQYACDGYHLLEQVRGPGAPGSLRDLPAVQVLRRILIQQYYRDGEKVIRREDSPDTGLPPGRDRLVSPYDTDARYGEKRGTGWLGYKDHLAETVSDPADDDPATGRPAVPNLITDVQTTHAAVPDAVMTGQILDCLDDARLLPGELFADSGYMSADHLITARQRDVTLTGPLLADVSPQARAGGYTQDAFTIDWDRQQVTCPQGTLSRKWTPSRNRSGADTIIVQFPPAACRACPVRDACTRSLRNGRQLGLRPRQTHEAITAARAAQDTQDWQRRYAARAGVEGLMRQATHVTGMRRARYLGLDRTCLQSFASATAINAIRLGDWLDDTPIGRTRTTHLQRLVLSPAA